MLLFFLQASLALSDYLRPLEPLSLSAVCSAFSCATSKIHKPFSNSCISPYSSSITYLWQCPAESTANFCNTTSMACQVPPASAPLAYVGESCVLASDCYLSSCFQGTCKGFAANTACTSHEQCDVGLMCSSRSLTCQPQVAAGAGGCRSYLECVNWATCNMTYTSENGTCVEYASLANGAAVTDCSGGFSYMCASGYCYKKYPFSPTGVCRAAPVSNYTLPLACTASSNCTGVLNGALVVSQCVCGYNPYGTSYCAPFIGDPPGQTMLISWNFALKKSGVCNTARRGSSDCMKRIGMLKNTTQATLGFYRYPLYIANDACIKEIYTPEYYSVVDGGVMSIGLAILGYLYL